MRTTLNIDDQLLISAKHLAIEQGKPLTKLVEDALREVLARQGVAKQRVSLATARGKGLRPGVDLDSSASLADLMDD